MLSTVRDRILDEVDQRPDPTWQFLCFYVSITDWLVVQCLAYWWYLNNNDG